MELHRTRVPHKIDPPSGKACKFCKRFHPEFERRNPASSSRAWELWVRACSSSSTTLESISQRGLQDRDFS